MIRVHVASRPHANTNRRKHHRQDRRHKCRWCLSASTVYIAMYPTVFCCPKTPSMNQPRDSFLCTLWCHLPQSDVTPKMQRKAKQFQNWVCSEFQSKAESKLSWLLKSFSAVHYADRPQLKAKPENMTFSVIGCLKWLDWKSRTEIFIRTSFFNENVRIF